MVSFNYGSDIKGQSSFKMKGEARDRSITFTIKLIKGSCVIC